MNAATAAVSSAPPSKFVAYKLIIDPWLHRDQMEKVVRYDGVIPGDEMHVRIFEISVPNEMVFLRF